MNERDERDRPLEIIFLVEEAREGGFTARARGESIFTEAAGLATLHDNIRDAARCHFDGYDFFTDEVEPDDLGTALFAAHFNVTREALLERLFGR